MTSTFTRHARGAARAEAGLHQGLKQEIGVGDGRQSDRRPVPGIGGWRAHRTISGKESQPSEPSRPQNRLARIVLVDHVSAGARHRRKRPDLGIVIKAEQERASLTAIDDKCFPFGRKIPPGREPGWLGVTRKQEVTQAGRLRVRACGDA